MVKLHTLIVPGEGDRTSRVANAGAPVSPAAKVPRLDFLLGRGLSVEECAMEGNLLAVESVGKASVVATMMLKSKEDEANKKQLQKGEII